MWTTVREAMRGVEPIGIGSRNVAESLLAQIAYLGELGEMECPPIAAAIVRDHLADLGERRFAQIAAALGTTSAEVLAAWEFVKVNLQPVPDGGVHGGGGRRQTRTIVRPDVLIRDIDGELTVEVVESRRFSPARGSHLRAPVRRHAAQRGDRGREAARA